MLFCIIKLLCKMDKNSWTLGMILPLGVEVTVDTATIACLSRLLQFLRSLVSVAGPPFLLSIMHILWLCTSTRRVYSWYNIQWLLIYSVAEEGHIYWKKNSILIQWRIWILLLAVKAWQNLGIDRKTDKQIPVWSVLVGSVHLLPLSRVIKRKYLEKCNFHFVAKVKKVIRKCSYQGRNR